MAHDLSPEFRLVAACVLATDEMLTQRARELCSGVIDWDRVRALARHHMILAMTGERLAQAAPDMVPDELAAAARAEMNANLALQMAQAHHTARVVRVLAGRGVRSIVLKGGPLARMLYPEQPAWRPSSDIDLLIDPHDLAEADAALRACDHEREWPDEETLARVDPALIGRFVKDFQYVERTSGHRIEVHHRLIMNPHVLPFSFDELQDRSVEVETDFGPVHALDGLVLYGYLAWHAIVDIHHALKWIADVTWMRRRLEVQGVATLPSAMPPRIPSRAIALAAEVEDRLLGTTSIRSDRQVETILANLDQTSRESADRSLTGLPREAAYVAFQWRMVESAKARAYVVWRMLADPRDALSLGGRPMPWAVYAIAGPFLSLWRYLRRRPEAGQ